MTTTPDDQEKALRLIFRGVSPAAGDPGEDLVLRLREVREARGDVLTDDEYQAFRADIIEQIIRRVRMPWILSVVFALCCVMGAGFLGWGIWTGDGGTGVGGGVCVVLCVLWWRSLHRDYAAKRAIPKEARVELVKRLLGEELISGDEAAQYIAQIEATFAGDSGSGAAGA